LGLISQHSPQPELPDVIRKLAEVRRKLPALLSGDYHELLVAHQQLAFSRHYKGQTVIVALNSTSETASITLSLDAENGTLRDQLDQKVSLSIANHQVEIPLSPTWGRILLLE
jgi:glycosidase